jgi:RHS repeat-associated protein
LTDQEGGFESTSTFNPLTGKTVSTTDLNDRVTVGTYDSLGRLLTATFPQHATGNVPSVQYEYSVNASGLNSVKTLKLGADGVTQHASVILYDGMMRPFQTQSEGFDAGANDAATATQRGRSITQTYFDSAGRMARQTGEWFAEGVPGGPVVPIAVPPSLTTYEYDDAGRVTDEVFWVGNSSNPANEKWRTITSYDGKETLQIPPMGGTPQRTTVDARGRTTELREYKRDADVSSAADTPDEVLSLPSQAVTYTYNVAGERVGMQNASNDAWTYFYDWAGRQVKSIDPDAGTTESTYDKVNRVTTRKNGAGQIVAYEYDNLDRVTAVRDNSLDGPMRAEYEYDTSLDLNGHAVLGQLASSTRFSDGEPYKTTIDRYDNAYQALSTTVWLPDTTDLGALPGVDSTHGAKFTTQFTYTADGQVASTTLPAVASTGDVKVLGKEIVTTRYDSASVPAWMSGGFGWGTYVADNRVGPDGRPLVTDLGTTYGAIVSYQYEDGTKRLTNIALDRERFDGSDVDVKFDYDAAGNIKSLKNQPSTMAASGSANQDNQCFDYDGLQRLQTAWTSANANCSVAQQPISSARVGGTAPYWTDYTFDARGNRTQMVQHGVGGGADSVTTYTHGAGTDGPHQLSSLTTQTGTASTSESFSYDGAGNRTSKVVDGTTTALTWDSEGELASHGDDSNVYDASGNRLVRRDAAGVTLYLPGGQEVLVDGETVTATRNYGFAGKTVAIRTGSGLGAVTSLVSDHQGSVIAAVPNTEWLASSVVRVFSDAFGGARANSDSQVPGDKRFLGATLDAGSSLSLLGARYYDAAVGKFVSVDPMLDPSVPAQFNAYVYSGNNPVTWSDPSGLFWDPWKAAKNAWNGWSSWAKKYEAEITGAVVGMAVFAGCMVVTAGVGSIGCAVAGGAAGGAVTSLWKTQVMKTEKFTWQGLVTDTVVGGVVGGLTAGAGAVLGGVVKAAIASPAGVAVTSALKSGANAVMSKVGNAVASVTKSAAKTCSFIGATVVLMADGSTKRIDDVKPGDLVVASDPQTGEQEAKPVLEVFVHEDAVVDLEVDGEVISTTEDHPYWSETEQRFERADQLEAGELLLTAEGDTVATKGLVGGSERAELAYNLSVEGIHTYHVGTAEILVHNECGPSLFGSLQNASQGIKPYSVQKTVTAGQKNEIQAHHLIEKRLVTVMGGNTNEWATVVVTRAEHQVFTNAWRKAIPYGKYADLSPADVLNAATQIYRRYPEIREALGIG